MRLLLLSESMNLDHSISFIVRMAGKCFRKNTTIRKHEQIFYRCAELICQNIDQANVKPNNSAII